MLPPLPRCSSWTYSSLVSPSRISLPRKGCRVGLHIDLFEVCSAFTRVAACTLARPPVRGPLYRRLQPFRHLHDCPGCFRRERVAGWVSHPLESAAFHGARRVEVWRGCCRSNISVAAPFVWRCLTGSAVAPSPHPAHRTGHADLPHPALGQDLTPSPTTRRAQADSGVRARSARRGARVDRSRLCVA